MNRSKIYLFRRINNETTIVVHNTLAGIIFAKSQFAEDFSVVNFFIIFSNSDSGDWKTGYWTTYRNP